jgi:eukaryotic-like serine/threonine-protein kinase
VTTFGKYQLVEKLGRGGMGEVWRAKILGPGGFERQLVVKRILAHLAEEPRFVSMFFAEARLCARLHHPNIVQVYELGEVAGEYFLAMEYVQGRDLSTALAYHQRRGTPAPGFGALVAREVCRALAYAHALTDDDGKRLELIHRDVSPSNIMLGYEGAVKLLDFGLAKALAESSGGVTRTGALKGKLGYLSPEQVGGLDADHRVDQWAVGVTLHEALTGRRLFSGNDIEVLALVAGALVDPPSKWNPEVPRELDRICLRALARDRADRFRDCEEMGQALDEVVHALKWSPHKMGAFLRELAPPPRPAPRLAPAGAKLGEAVSTGESGIVWVIESSKPEPAPVEPSAAVDANSVTPVAVAVPPADDWQPPAEPPAAAWNPPATSSSELTPARSRVPLVAVLVAAAAGLAIGGWALFAPEAPPEIAPQPVVSSPLPSPAPVVPPPAVVVVPSPAASAPPPVAAPARPASKPVKQLKKKPPTFDADRGDVVDPFAP